MVQPMPRFKVDGKEKYVGGVGWFYWDPSDADKSIRIEYLEKI
jgi:hypothetical protein